MKVLFTRSARRQIATIVAGIAAHSPRGALNVRARIAAVTGLLADHPGVGRMTDVDGVRRVTVVPYPYLIFYRVVFDAVIIQLVRHAARDPSRPGGD